MTYGCVIGSKFLVVAAALLAISSSARAEQASAQPSATNTEIVGTVVSAPRGVVVVKTDDGHYLVFRLDRDVVRPKNLAPGARVRVESSDTTEGDETDRTATSVTVEAPAPQTPSSSQTADAIPPRVRQIERDIEKNARRYRVGVRAGVALDPELIDLGAHATFGPIFSRQFLFRPNVEFAYGELTTLLALNLEGIYRLSATMPRNRWSPYVGGGPTLGFGHQGFSGTSDGRTFDFSQFTFHSGVNLLVGFEKPSGVFVELKSSVYTDPHLRLLFGFTF